MNRLHHLHTVVCVQYFFPYVYTSAGMIDLLIFISNQISSNSASKLINHSK